MLRTDIVDQTAASEDILHPGSRALFRHWEAIRGENSAPRHAQLDLGRIRDLVPSLFLAEHSFRHGYIWRLAGTQVCDLWRRELTGTPIATGWDRFERDTLERLFDGVVRRHQPFILRFRLTSSLGHLIAAEMIGLPMLARHVKMTHVLGAILPFRGLSLLGYDAISRLEIQSARVIWTEPVPGGAPHVAACSEKETYSPFEIIHGGREN
ncbi:hypothetical protein BH10PSE7_BH10PSE7_27100 [soil metagenome]